MRLNDKERQHLSLLADDVGVDMEELESIYIVEYERLQRVARVDVYLPLLAERNVRERIKKDRH